MKLSKLLGAAAVIALSISLSACAATTTPVIAPVTKDVGDLQGTTVELVVGQVLNINTDDLAVDSYTGVIADTKIAEFVQGKEEGDATFNPGVTALAVGTTQVTMTNSDGGIQPLTFSVEVSAK